MKKTLTFLLLAVLTSLSSAMAQDIYNGLFSDSTSTNGVTLDRSGYFMVKVAPTKAFSGTLSVDGRKWSFTGGTNKLFVDAVAKPILRTATGQSSLTVRFHLPLDGSDTITGSVSNNDGSWSSDLLGNRKIVTASYAGHYTMVIPGSTNSAESPGGDGYGLVVVGTDGMIKIAGSHLADGQNVQQLVPVSKNGDWPFFSWANRGTNHLYQSAIMGWISVTNGLTGDLAWNKYAMPYDLRYTNGFRVTTAPVASPYFVGNPGVTPIFGGLTNGQVTFEGGGLSDLLTNSATLAVNKFTTDKVRKFTLSVIPTTGKLTVSFTNDFGVAKGFGVVLTNQSGGSGYFLPVGNQLSGRFLLEMQ